MGQPVTLDSDDVLALLVAAEALGRVEDHFKAREDDVQIMAIGGVSGVRERLKTVNRAWNNAITPQEPLQGPTPAEVDALYVIRKWWQFDIGEGDEPQQPMPDTSMIDALRRKRLVVAGMLIHQIKWGDKSVTTITAATDRLRYKITERGYKFI